MEFGCLQTQGCCTACHGMYLEVSTSVVDDDVSNGLHTILMHDCQQLPQLSFCAILAVDVVVVSG